MTERKNLVASILARLKNIAKENDVVYGEILARVQMVLLTHLPKTRLN